ncbi:hypothetical protein COO60DRAFT_1464529 [Scenedesmus sp. NREL 46B-D3]|nr:hypothetical protein COO60DRAFT_1464529 [Scenedesmus sp. NREL 46B-D3]
MLGLMMCTAPGRCLAAGWAYHTIWVWPSGASCMPHTHDTANVAAAACHCMPGAPVQPDAGARRVHQHATALLFKLRQQQVEARQVDLARRLVVVDDQLHNLPASPGGLDLHAHTLLMPPFTPYFTPHFTLNLGSSRTSCSRSSRTSCTMHLTPHLAPAFTVHTTPHGKVHTILHSRVCAHPLATPLPARSCASRPLPPGTRSPCWAGCSWRSLLDLPRRVRGQLRGLFIAGGCRVLQSSAPHRAYALVAVVDAHARDLRADAAPRAAPPPRPSHPTACHGLHPTPTHPALITSSSSSRLGRRFGLKPTNAAVRLYEPKAPPPRPLSASRSQRRRCTSEPPRVARSPLPLEYICSAQALACQIRCSEHPCQLNSQELVTACIFVAAKAEEVNVSVNHLINSARLLSRCAQHQLLQALAPLNLVTVHPDRSDAAHAAAAAPAQQPDQQACFSFPGMGTTSQPTGKHHGGKGARLDDEYMMMTYKVIPCSRVSTHNWKLCHFSHVGEVTARRRHPSCHQADLCAYVSANAFESWLHPDRFKTTMCSYGSACTRKFCFLRTAHPSCASLAWAGPQRTTAVAVAVNARPPKHDAC